MAATFTEIVDKFDLAWNWLQETFGTSAGYIVSDRNRYTRPCTAIPEAFYNLPQWATRSLTLTFGTAPAVYLVFNSDFTEGAASNSVDFMQAGNFTPGSVLPVHQDYWYCGPGTAADTVVLDYGFVNQLTPIGIALAQMYDLTKTAAYLDGLRGIVQGLADRLTIDSRGTAIYMRKLLEASPQYTGMGQGLHLELFRLLADRETLSPELDEMYTALCLGMTLPGSHTAEGVRNHWANSLKGVADANQRLGITPLVPASEVAKVKVLVQQMQEFDGKAPYCWSPTAAAYPCLQGKEAYLSYDSARFTHLDRSAPGLMAPIVPLFHRTLYHGIMSKSALIYRGQCMEAATYAAREWDITCDTFVESQFERAMIVTTYTYGDACGLMLIFSHVLQYWKDALDSGRGYLGEHVMPVIQFDNDGYPEHP